MTRCFAYLAHTQACSKLFHIEKHPLWQALLAQKQSGGPRPNFDRAAHLIVYAHDPADQYWKNDEAKRAQKTRRAAADARISASKTNMPDNIALDDGHVKAGGVSCYLQHTLRHDRVYFIPVSCALVHHMEKALVPGAMSTQNKRRRVSQADGCSSMSLSSAVSVPERIYVKPVSLHPARGKQLHGLAASVSWLKHGDLAVSVHLVSADDDIDMDAKWVVANLTCAFFVCRPMALMM